MDPWTSGEAYESYIGRWSRAVAPRFLEWLDVPPGRAWLDVGCGTGALAAAILDLAEPARAVGLDPSEGYLTHARMRLTDPRITFRIGDALAVPAEGGEFDAVVSGLALNFVPDPAAALSEFRRVLVPGGLVAAYVWDYAGEMQMLRHFWDAVADLDPNAGSLQEGPRFPLCHPDRLRELFADAACSAVEVRAIDVPTKFRNFDDYWSPFLGGQGPAAGYVVSLDDTGRAQLAGRIRAALPHREDGSIELVARAWAVKGRR